MNVLQGVDDRVSAAGLSYRIGLTKSVAITLSSIHVTNTFITLQELETASAM